MICNLKVLQKILPKATKAELEDMLRRVQADLRFLEREQTQYREAVRMALKAKDIVNIQELSKDICFLRRMPNGLQEMNVAIAEIYKHLYKFLPW